MKSLLDSGIRNSYVRGCPIELFNAMAAGLGGLPLPVAKHAFGVTLGATDVGSVFYAGSRRSFNTGYAQWTAPRVIQTQLLQLDAGIAAFRIESDTHYLEAWFDSDTSTWTGVVDGVEQAMIATGFLDDIVTFRISGNDAEVKVNDAVVATSDELFLGESVRVLISWNSTGGQAGDVMAGQIIGGIYADAIEYADAGDGDWCGQPLNVQAISEPLPDPFTALVSPPTVLRHDEVSLTSGTETEALPAGMSPSASGVEILRHQEVSETEDTFSEALPMAISPSSTAPVVTRHQEFE